MFSSAITIFLNYYFLRKGISKGIEVLAKIGMPVLFIFGIILVVRVLTLGTPATGVSSDWQRAWASCGTPTSAS